MAAVETFLLLGAEVRVKSCYGRGYRGLHGRAGGHPVMRVRVETQRRGARGLSD